MQHASDSIRFRTEYTPASSRDGQVELQSDTHKKTSYQVGPTGIEIVDRRQLTHGAIVPNYVVDLYLPIIGYDGLGILTLLYRRANADDRVMTNLDKFARAGRLGFRRFSQLLNLLEELEIIAVQKPTGVARRQNHHTMITLLDPPAAVPEAWTDEVLDRTVTPWLVAPSQAGEESSPPANGDVPTNGDVPNCQPPVPELSATSSSNCHLTVRELSPNSSQGCTHLTDVPNGNEPIGRKQGRAGTAAPRRAAAHSSQALSRQEDDEKHNRPMNQSKALLRDLWNQHAARPRHADDTRLQQLSDEFGEAWVAAAITSLSERAPIFKLDAVRITLERWRREDSWGSPAPRRGRITMLPSPKPLAGGDPRRCHPVIARFIETLATVPSSEQADAMIAKGTDDEAWVQTLHDWRLNGHRARNVAGLLDKYAKRLRSQDVPAGSRPQQPQAHMLESMTMASVNIDEATTALWKRVQLLLAGRLSESEFDAWVAPAAVVRMDEREVTIAAGNVFACEKLRKEYLPLFEAAFTSEVGRRLAVTVEIT